MDDALIGFAILLAVLIGIGAPVTAVIAVVLAHRSRRELRGLLLRLDRVEAELRAPRGTSDAVLGQGPAIPAEPVPAQPMPAAPPEAEEVRPASVPPISAAAARPAPPRQDLEETLGSRWAVWVGGVALALGGIFLVRYSIEQNLLDPRTRIVLGILFALALVGTGEWMRRRESGFDLPGLSSANVPSILTAAGICTAFASAYAAYALYGLIGPGTTFVTLGLIAVLAMVASTLHGPTLAALGLLGAMGSPLLVSSDEPQPWALVVYLAFVVLPAYGVARLRLWRWLALAAATGALLWTTPIFFIGEANGLPAMVHLVLQAGLAAFFLAVDPYRHVPDDEALTDRAAGVVLLAFAMAGILVTGTIGAGDGRPVFVSALALVLLAAGIRIANVSTAAASSAVLAAGALVVWPLAGELGNAPENLFYQSGDVFAVRPYALDIYLLLAALLPSAIAGASLWRLARSRGLRLPVAAWYAAAAGPGPLLVLVAAYWRVTAFERSLSFALVAGILGLVFVLAAQWLMRRGATDEDAAIRLGLGSTASAALGAVALGLTFALEKGMLTVAFALSALGTAWVAERIAIPALRYAVGAIGLIVLGRLIWDPTIVGGDPGPVIVNWLLWGYGVPAVSFWLAGRLLERSGRDRVVQLAESLAIVFAAFLVFFEIRHVLHAGDPLAADFSLLEAGLVATESLAFAILLTRMSVRRPDPVYRWGSLIFKAASFGLSAIGLLLVENPLISGHAVSGGTVFNSLILAYLLPAILAGALALTERRARPWIHALATAILSLVLLSAYVGLAIRRIFMGPELAGWRGHTQGEQWSYSVALLLIGVALLGSGILRGNRFARIASAVYLVLAVLKVFIVDLSHLEGVMRALSFIGLGLVLIGIGLVYQRFLVRRPSNAAIS
ncbi:DUF2339 domain-containing protein [Microvirga sp. M2]|uniref:DUF2339 domain-containing protein n=1 Tax=Microvirga sp. M2 TaxID=3073270 RepID=UPI0039C0E0D6